MLKRIILSGMLLLPACGALPGVKTSPELAPCDQETVLAFACGPEDEKEYDDQGRQLATCYMDDQGDHVLLNRGTECTASTFHCMPETYCRARCRDGQETCPTATTSW